jgi:MFS family permease
MNRISPKWRVVVCLWIAFALNYVDRQAVFSIFPVLRKELGFTSSQLGLVGTLFNWLYALCMPLAGYFADGLRRDRLIVVSLILWSAATLGTAFSRSPIIFLTWRAAMGLTESMYFPAALGIIAIWHPGSTRSRALGIHQAAQLAGIITGGWFGGWAASHIGWRTGFATLGLTGLLYSAALVGFFHALPAPVEESTSSRFQRFENHLPRVPLYWMLMLAFACYCGTLWIAYAWLPNMLYERFHLSLAASGLNATIFIQICCMIGVVGGGWLADRIAPFVPLARLCLTGFGMFLSAPFAYLMFAAPSIPQFRIYAALFGLLSGLNFANIFAGAYDIIPDKNYSFAGGLLNMAGGISAGVTVGLVGYFHDTLGTNAVMAVSAGLTVFAAAALLLTAWRSLRAPARPTAHASP